MYVVCVHIRVKPESVEEFIAASLDNHEGTRRSEPGNVRWDLLQSDEDPTRFLLYEVYRSRDDFPLHQQTPHYQRWRERVAGMMAEPRSASRWRNVAPEDDAWGR